MCDVFTDRVTSTRNSFQS